MIESEVVLIAKRSPEDEVRWVYLYIGKFHGLAETIDVVLRASRESPFSDWVQSGSGILMSSSAAERSATRCCLRSRSATS